MKRIGRALLSIPFVIIAGVILLINSYRIEASTKPLIVMYTSTACSACQNEKIVLNSLVAQGLALVRYKPQNYRSPVIPKIIIYKNGKVVKVFIGYTPESVLRQWL